MNIGSRLRWLYAFIQRDLREGRSYRVGRLLEFSGIAVSVLTFYFLGRLVDQGAPAALAGRRYFGFAVSGLAMASLAYQVVRGFAGALRQAQIAGTLEALFLSPLTGWQIALGSGLSSVVRGLLRSGFFLLGAGLLGAVELEARLLWLPLVLLLAALSFLPWGLLAASAVLLFQRGDPLGHLLNAATLLLAGVYFPVEVLPWWLRLVSQVYPVTHAVTLFRAVVLGDAPLLDSALWLLAFTCVALPVSAWLFERAVVRARGWGSLGRL